MELSDNENEGGRGIGNSEDASGTGWDKAEEEPAVQNDDDTVGEGRRIDPARSRKKMVRNPQPKLNAERIQGPKGIQTIESNFKGFRFGGRGHEQADLNRVMKRLEHWAHRLFPKYTFGDFLEKIETLGSKKNVQVFIKKYRLGMIMPDDEIVGVQHEEEPNIAAEYAQKETPVDEFDKLIAEEIEKKSQVSDTPTEKLNKPIARVLGSASTAKPSELTEEIKARIEANRKLAIERKNARLRREEESKKRKLEESEVDCEISNFVQVPRGNEISSNGADASIDKSPVESALRKKDEQAEPNKMPRAAIIAQKAEDFSKEPIPTAEFEKGPQIIHHTVNEKSLGDVVDHGAAINFGAEATYDFQHHNLDKTDTQHYTELNKDPENVLTHAELLMEIEGAMEEIINKSIRRST